jgi:two-component system LytT family sensor kinase
MRTRNFLHGFIQYFSQNRHLYHYLFWITLFISMSFDMSSFLQEMDFAKYMLLVSGRIVLIMALVYNHLSVLLPVFYKTKKPVYWIGLLISVLFFCLLNIGFNRLLAVPSLVQTINFSSISIHFFVALRLLFLSTILKLTVDWYDQQKQIQELQIVNLRSEIKFLKMQLNPHFIFNTLNNLQSLIVTRSAQASEVVENLSDIMDYMLYGSNESFVSLSKEVNYIKNYLFLEKIRIDKSSKVTLHVTGDIDAYRIAPLLLLPLIENGIKHGLNKLEKNAFLTIDIEINDGTLLCTIKNNTAENRVLNNNGIGILNLTKRLELLYKNGYSFKRTYSDQVHTASLILKLI